MECVLEGNPAPEITWFQGQKVIADSNRVRLMRKSCGKDTYLLTLEISSPTREDGGNYRCNAFNTYGESNANIALNFQGMPARRYSPRMFHLIPARFSAGNVAMVQEFGHTNKVLGRCMCIYKSVYIYVNCVSFFFFVEPPHRSRNLCFCGAR